MKFSELRDSMQSFTGASTAEYQLNYLSKDTRKALNDIGYKYVEYLTKDITKTELNIDLKEWLGLNYYQASNDNAKECLDISLSIDHIWGRRIKSWTDSALKCYDNFLIKYIQIDKEETIPKKNIRIKETDVYNYLLEKEGYEKKIGQNFKYIYQLRSSYHHVQVEEYDGTRTIKRISNSKYNRDRDLIVSWFREAITNMLLILIKKESDVKTEK